MNKSIFLLIFGLIRFAEAYNVLVVYPFYVKSMNFLGEGIVGHLLEAGHQVTYITCFPIKKELKDLHQIDISSNGLSIMAGSGQYFLMAQHNGPVELEFDAEALTIKEIMNGNVPMNDLTILQEFGVVHAKATFENEDVKKLLEDTNIKFDVVIADLYETEVFSGFSAVYNCPMIWSWSMGVQWLITRLVDEATNPAYTASYVSSNVPPLGFKQRVEELWTQIKWHWYKRTQTMPIEKALYTHVFTPLLQKRGRSLPDYEELIYNASLIFANDHLASGTLPSTPQNFKLIGGQHIKKSDNPMPQDIKEIMDNAKHGVIYFSMGTFWKSKDMPLSVLKGLVKMFGELKQTVIWKFEEDLPDLPKNLKIMKWAPQQSILDHPNCLMFVTHGGLLSSIEAVHFGVPIIGVPIFLDQFININRAGAKGYAIGVSLSYDLPANLKIAIQTMLTEPKYKRKVQELSVVYHDRPLPPGAEVVHWVEHVVKTKGAPHLRSPALNVPFYQKVYLDLAAVVAVTCAVLGAVLKVSFKILLKRRGKKEKRN